VGRHATYRPTRTRAHARTRTRTQVPRGPSRRTVALRARGTLHRPAPPRTAPSAAHRSGGVELRPLAQKLHGATASARSETARGQLHAVCGRRAERVAARGRAQALVGRRQARAQAARAGAAARAARSTHRRTHRRTHRSTRRTPHALAAHARSTRRRTRARGSRSRWLRSARSRRSTGARTAVPTAPRTS
jgi:hypothetical protein